jgi:CheY-like chemotaxis protein
VGNDQQQVLVVEDNMITALYYASVVEVLGYRVCGKATTAQQAIALAADMRPAAILMDVRLKGSMDGIEAARSILDGADDPYIIYITGSNEPETMKRITESNPAAILVKPVMAEQLERTQRKVLTH